MGCPIGHCSKKTKSNQSNIQKSKNPKFCCPSYSSPEIHLCVWGTPFWVMLFSLTFSVHCRGPTFCWGSPISCCFIFVCFKLSSPLIQYSSGGTLFCTVLLICSFDFCIPGCYLRWCGVSVGLFSLRVEFLIEN